MEKALLIAEKPDLMRKIKSVYDKNKKELPYSVDFLSQRGHLVEIKQPNELDEEKYKYWDFDNLPLDRTDYQNFKYKVKKEKKVGNFPTAQEYYKKIQKALKENDYDFIIHAGDPDQEGELLIRLVLQQLKNKKPVKRYWTNELTEDSILNALKNLKDDNKDKMLINLYEAALTRQHIDCLWGINLTEGATLVGRKNGLVDGKNIKVVALGRVMSSILGMVCIRENEIKNFKPTTTYGLTSLYDSFNGFLLDENEVLKYYENKEDALKEIERLKALNSDLKGKVVSIQEKTVKTQPPKFFKLATCQIEAGKKFGYSSDKTLKLLQSLYEKELMSYPRTDCEYLGSHEDLKSFLDVVFEIPDFEEYKEEISKSNIEKVLKNKRFVNDSALKDSGHFALRPTNKKADFTSLSMDEINIYTMCCKRFLTVFLDDLKQKETTIVVKIGDKNFRSKGKVLLEEGFTKLAGRNANDAELPSLKEGDIININDIEISEKTTQCPKRFTDATLIEACEKPAKFLLQNEDLKSLGKKLKIGTPATRASIIKKLIENKYLQTKKKEIVPTDKGGTIYNMFKDLPVFAVEMTGEWEIKLENIRQGKKTREDFETETEKEIKKNIEKLRDLFNSIEEKKGSRKMANNFEQIGVCECGGKIMLGEKNFFCTNCGKSSARVFSGHKFTTEEILDLYEGKELTFNDLVSKAGKNYKATLKLGDKSFEFVNNDSKTNITCPYCKEKMTENAYKVTCPKCGLSVWRKIAQKTLSEKELKDLIEKGETEKLDGFMSKKGNEFSAIIKRDKKGATTFSFD